MPAVTLSAGSIHYDRSGPGDGRPVVFIHGYAMGRSLWRPLTDRLAERGFLCIAPTWPLGAHEEAMRPEAELTMEGVAAMVGELLEALGLEDVVFMVLVGLDAEGVLPGVHRHVTHRHERVLGVGEALEQRVEGARRGLSTRASV